jgi:tyrosyl-tRNA synthetase
MNLHEDLLERGLSYQQTDEAGLDLALRAAATPITLYVGFDPSADSLHAGNLLGLLILRRFQLAGHRAIALMGGATGMIGDPSGKTRERLLLDEERLRHNINGIAKAARRVLAFDGPNPALLVNNYDWFKDVNVLWFLREVGKHFTVNHMVAKESVRVRLEDREHGISYTEFSYMLLQAYDFYRLYRDHGCTLQVGGSDQWGNITAGIELTRRKEAADAQAAPKLFGLTHPLVTKSDGTKFGKSEQGSIWLDPAKTSPYRFYQFFLQTADADVLTYLNYFTFMPSAQRAALAESLRREPEKRAAQHALSNELTRLVHGEDGLGRAEKASQALFGASIRELDEAALLEVMADAPSTQKQRSVLDSGYAIVDALVDSGLCASKGAARRDLSAGGIYVNNERVSDANALLVASELIAGGHMVLRKGKKTHHLLRFT